MLIESPPGNRENNDSNSPVKTHATVNNDSVNGFILDNKENYAITTIPVHVPIHGN